jgi:2-dehydropantoate 2-reductase
VRIAVLGPGGVGGLLAGLLAQAGDEVVVLAGDETAREIGRRGISVKSQRFGNFSVAMKTATRLSEPVDACFVTVKATQLRDATARVPVSALGDGIVIPLLNGIEHVEVLRTIYPPEHVVAGAIRIETTRTAPGVIEHTSPFAVVDLGPGGEAVAERLRSTGLDVRLRDDEMAMLWDKLALLAPMALLTTYEGAPVGEMRARRRGDAVAMIREIARIAAAADGVTVDPEAIVRVFDMVPASMETSMQRDQQAGRPTELDALGGALLRRAAKAGVEAPVTSRLVAALQARSTPVR